MAPQVLTGGWQPGATLPPHAAPSRDVNVGYARISIEEAKTGSISISRQVEGLRRIDPNMQIFIDDGVSGNTIKRPGLDALLRFIHEAGATHLWVARQDRFMRCHDAKAIVPDLWFAKGQFSHLSCGCKLQCFEEDSPDLGSDMGRMLFDIRCNLAATESDKTSRRQQAAIERRLSSDKPHRQGKAGYLLVDGRLIPDDMPRHCPLPQRREVQGPFDEWGIALDAHPGFSNFELVALGLKQALATFQLKPVFDWLHEHVPITQAGEWNEAKSRYEELKRRRSVEEIIVGPDGAPMKTRRMLGSPHPLDRHTLDRRLQSPTYMGHSHGRANWNPNAAPSLRMRTTEGGTWFGETRYEFYVENTHVPILDESDVKRLIAWNQRRRKALQHNSQLVVRSHAGLRRAKPDSKLSQDRVDPSLVALRTLSSVFYCGKCGKRMQAHTLKPCGKTRRSKTYHYVRCHHANCEWYMMSSTLPNAVGGLAILLADACKQIQNGQQEIPAHRPAVTTRLRELQSDYAEWATKPSNRVRKNILATIQAEIDAIVQNPTSETDILSLEGRQMLMHPNATKAGTWLELATSGNLEAVSALCALIDQAFVGYVNGGPQRPHRPGMRRPRTSPSEIAVTKITLRKAPA